MDELACVNCGRMVNGSWTLCDECEQKLEQAYADR